MFFYAHDEFVLIEPDPHFPIIDADGLDLGLDTLSDIN